MTDKEKTRKEVERLINELIQERGKYYSSDVDDACILELQNVLTYIDSLQEELVSEELEEACEQLAENARKHKAETSSPFFSQTDYRQGVIDGAKWQKEQMMAKAFDGEILENYDGKVIKYDDTILDEKLSDCKVFDKVKIIVIKED